MVDGLTLEDAAGTGPGTLSITSDYAGLTMAGGGTLDNASIILDLASAFLSGGTAH